MEPYKLDHDIKLLCIPAASFPDGVAAAYRKLHSLVPPTRGRKFFGISWMDARGEMIYKACVEEAYPGETEQLGGETFVVKKGDYISIVLHDFMSDTSVFGKAFRQLTAGPRIDPQGAGVEMYLGPDEVRCMVRLDPQKTTNLN
jgi:hypothetical protein